jgi:hypothetical protein
VAAGPTTTICMKVLLPRFLHVIASETKRSRSNSRGIPWIASAIGLAMTLL